MYFISKRYAWNEMIESFKCSHSALRVHWRIILVTNEYTMGAVGVIMKSILSKHYNENFIQRLAH